MGTRDRRIRDGLGKTGSIDMGGSPRASIGGKVGENSKTKAG